MSIVTHKEKNANGATMAASQSVVFVCTGNIFRSFCAERSLRAIAPDLHVYSRGIEPAIEPNQLVLSRMQHHNLSTETHIPTKIAAQFPEHLHITMSRLHQMILKNRFGLSSILFQELVLGKALSILDVNESILHYQHRQTEVRSLVEGTISYIVSVMPVAATAIRSRLQIV